MSSNFSSKSPVDFDGPRLQIKTREGGALQATNYQAWHRAMGPIVRQSFPLMIKIVEEDIEDEPMEPQLRQRGDANDDEWAATQAIWHGELREYPRKRDRYNECKVSFFGFLTNTIHEDSKDHVLKNNMYLELRKESNVLGLWTLIKAKFCSNPSSSVILKLADAQQAYYSLKQGNMSLVEYARAHEDAYAVLLECGGSETHEGERAMHFISNLSPAHHDFVLKIRNDEVFNSTGGNDAVSSYPESIRLALEMALNFLPSRGRDKQREEDRKVTVHSAGVGGSAFAGDCWKCGGPHKMKDCNRNPAGADKGSHGKGRGHGDKKGMVGRSNKKVRANVAGTNGHRGGGKSSNDKGTSSPPARTRAASAEPRRRIVWMAKTQAATIDIDTQGRRVVRLAINSAVPASSSANKICVGLDSMAGAHIFADVGFGITNSLKALPVSEQIVIIGVGNHAITARFKMHTAAFGEVYYCPEAKVNILSLALVMDAFVVTASRSRLTVKLGNDDQIHFERIDNTFVYEVPVELHRTFEERRCRVSELSARGAELLEARALTALRRSMVLKADAGLPTAEDLRQFRSTPHDKQRDMLLHLAMDTISPTSWLRAFESASLFYCLTACVPRTNTRAELEEMKDNMCVSPIYSIYGDLCSRRSKGTGRCTCDVDYVIHVQSKKLKEALQMMENFRDGRPVRHEIRHRIPVLPHGFACPGTPVARQYDSRDADYHPVFVPLHVNSLPHHEADRLIEAEIMKAWKRGIKGRRFAASRPLFESDFLELLRPYTSKRARRTSSRADATRKRDRDEDTDSDDSDDDEDSPAPRLVITPRTRGHKDRSVTFDAVHVLPLTTTQEAATAHTNTVENNLASFSKREIQDAKRAREYERRLVYPPIEKMKLLIQRGCRDIDVTAADVDRARAIWGPPVPALKGQRRSPQQQSARVALDYTNTIMHADIMFISGVPFMISKTTPCQLVMATEMQDRSQGECLDCITSHVEEHREYNLTPSLLRFDNEKGVIAAANDIRKTLHMKVDFCDPNDFVAEAEVTIRDIKGKCRSIIHSVPFRLHKKFTPYVVATAIMAINVTPDTIMADGLSAHERLTGQKLIISRHLRIAFGTYVQVDVRDPDNSTKPRTVGAIAMHSKRNSSGSVVFYIPSLDRYYDRHTWTTIPIPDDVIQVMNNLADADPIADIEELESAQDSAESESVSNDVTEEQTTANISEQRRQPRATTQATSETAPHEPTSLPPRPRAAGDPERPSSRLRPTAGRNYASQYMASITGTPYSDDEDDYDNSSKIRVNHMSLSKARSKYGQAAEEAAEAEIRGMIDRKVFKPIHTKMSNGALIRQGRAMFSFMFQKEKLKPDGSFDKLKSRLTGNGKMLDRSQYGETSSRTASRTSLMFVAAMAASQGRHVKAGDVPQAYLQADQKSELYVILDKDSAKIFCDLDPSYEEFLREDGTIVTIANKALYGGIESGKFWYDEISATLKELGFQQNVYDECVFNKTADGIQITIVLYVDDLFITCIREDYIDSLLEKLQRKYGKMKVHEGKSIDYLGMTFDYSEQGVAYVSMTGYIKELIDKFQVTGFAKTPATDDLWNADDSDAIDAAHRQIFHSAVMTIQYLAVNMRWDLLAAVSFLTTRVSNPTTSDWSKLSRVLKYINYTQDHALRIGGDLSEGFAVHIDASFAVHADMKSHTGCAIMMGGVGAIFARSSKQKINTKSSTEAELVAISDSLEKAIWLQNFVTSQGHPELAIMKLKQDNTSTIRLIESGPSSSGHSRYVDIKYFYVKDVVERGLATVEYTPTDEMYADGLTKPLQGQAFRTSTERLLGYY